MHASPLRIQKKPYKGEYTRAVKKFRPERRIFFMTDAHPTERFTGRSEAYAQSRPSYPEAAIQGIVDHCRLKTGDLLVDIGCGTGISSRLFADKGLQVIGIEPNDEMRRTAESQKHERITYRKATGEQTGLDASCANAVVAAQAFHWLKPDVALAEFHRILKPEGWVVLMWNERYASDPFTDAYGQLLRSLPDTKTVEMHRGAAGEPLLTCSLFTDACKLTFRNQQTLSQDGLLGRAFSTSYVPRTFPEADIFADQLRRLFAKFQQDDKVTMHYETSVYLAKKP
jgi:SAM-dependent methyltransferase